MEEGRAGAARGPQPRQTGPATGDLPGIPSIFDEVFAADLPRAYPRGLPRQHVRWTGRKDVKPFLKYFLPRGQRATSSNLIKVAKGLHLAFKGMETDEIYDVLMQQLVAAAEKYDPEYKNVTLIMEMIESGETPRNLMSLCAACHAGVHRLEAVRYWMPPLLVQLWMEQHPASPVQLQLAALRRL
jgi:hypothetical protein